MRGFLLTILVLFSALALACDDEPPSTATASPAPVIEASPTPRGTGTAPPLPLVDGLPRGVVGPLVVYDYGGQHRTVVVYDLGDPRNVATFRLPGDSLTSRAVGVSGRDIVASVDGAIRVYSLDGVEQRVLYEPTAPPVFHSAAVSPDGSMVAVTEQDVPGCEGPCLLILDVTDGTLLGRAVFGGLRPRLIWFDDNSGLMVQVTGTHRSGPVAAVAMDGTVTPISEAQGGLSPRGGFFAAFEDEYLPWENDQIGCSVFGTLVLYDRTGTAVAATNDPSSVVHRGRWAPDGSGFLYETRAAPAITDGPCSTAFEAWVALPSEWHFLSTADGASTPVADPEAFQAGWSQQSRVAVGCGDEEVPVRAESDGTYTIPPCPGSAATELHRFFVDGQEIGTYVHPRVVGFIEVP